MATDIPYTTTVFTCSFIVDITRINANHTIDQMLLQQFNKKFNGKCIEEGYIKPNSGRLLSRTIGKIDPEYFNSFCKYHCKFSIDICTPYQHQELIVTVNSVNKMGIKSIATPYYIIIAKQHHDDKALFDDIQEGDTIRISIEAFRIKYLTPQIEVIALLQDKIVSTQSTEDVIVEDIAAAAMEPTEVPVTDVDEARVSPMESGEMLF